MNLRYRVPTWTHLLMVKLWTITIILSNTARAWFERLDTRCWLIENVYLYNMTICYCIVAKWPSAKIQQLWGWKWSIIRQHSRTCTIKLSPFPWPYFKFCTERCWTMWMKYKICASRFLHLNYITFMNVPDRKIVRGGKLTCSVFCWINALHVYYFELLFKIERYEKSKPRL